MATHPINLTNQFLIAMPGMGDGTFAGTVEIGRASCRERVYSSV